MHTRFQRLLVIKIADLGDAILTLPALQALRHSYPEARIDVLTSPTGGEVLKLCAFVDKVITFEKRDTPSARGILRLLSLCSRLRRSHYDAVILIHHLTTRAGRILYRTLLTASGSPIRVGLDNGLGGFLTHPIPDRGFGAVPEWQYAVELVSAIGAEPSFQLPYLEVPPAAQLEAAQILRGVRKPFIVIHPGVGPFAPARQWSPAYSALLADRLTERGFTVIITGTEPERSITAQLEAIPGTVSLVGKTTLPVLAAVLTQASLVIGADSGVVHLAAALERPTLALFGPTNPEAWQPLGATVLDPAELRAVTQTRRIIALTLRLPCSPCCYVGYRVGRPNGCHTRSCLTRLDVDTVLAAALQLLRQSTAGDG